MMADADPDCRLVCYFLLFFDIIPDQHFEEVLTFDDGSLENGRGMPVIS